jgi:hypothetical protein
MLYIQLKDAEDGVEDDVREGERIKIGETFLQSSPCKVLLKPLLGVLFLSANITPTVSGRMLLEPTPVRIH